MLRVSPTTVLGDRISDAELALHLFVRNPHQFGGIILKVFPVSTNGTDLML